MKKLFVFLMLGMFMISFSSALDIDNVKDYNEQSKTITITNAFGLGDTLFKGQLITKQNQLTAPGNDMMVAMVKVYEYKIGTNDFGELKAYNINDGMKEIQREITLKYRTIEKEIGTPIYENICVDDLKNPIVNETNQLTTYKQICADEITGYTTEETYNWTEFTDSSELPKDNVFIGLFADVEVGDKIEWIPSKWFGETINEWASWTADTNVDIISVYHFDISDPIDSIGTNNGTNTGGSTLTGLAGKFNNSYEFESSVSDGIDLNAAVIPTGANADFTISQWIKIEDKDKEMVTFGQKTGAEAGRFNFGVSNLNKLKAFLGSGSSVTLLSTTSLTTATWYNVVIKRESGNISIYLDGEWEDSATSTQALSSTDSTIGAINDGSGDFDGLIDETIIWSRALTDTEINETLWNGGDGNTWTNVFDQLPTVTLNSPVDTFNTTSQTIIFNTTVTDDFNVNNVTLDIDGVLNETNISQVNGTYIFTKTLADGNHNWSILAYDNNSQSTQSATRTFTIDSTAPLIDIEAPTGTIDYGLIGGSETLNVTFTDAGLDSCWYNYNGTNVTIPGCLTGVKNSTTFTLESDNANLTVYANDTIGNLNSTFISWDYTLIEIAQSYSSPVIEGTTTAITSNVTLEAGKRVSSVVLNYNGTEYAGSYTEYATNTYYLSISKIVPNVATDTNITFFWNVTLEDGSAQSTASNNQTVLNLTADTCGTNTVLLFNFTQVDEKTQVKIVGGAGNTSLKADIILYNPTSNAQVFNYSNLFTGINPAAICINQNLSDSTFKLDAIIEYTATDKFIEYYNIDNYVLTNATDEQAITLYNLNESQGQEFKITYKDSNFNTLPGALIQIQRKYVDEGVFKTVEIPMVSSAGYTIAHLVRTDIIYNLIILNNGVVIASFNNIVAACQNPTFTECSININSFSDGTAPEDYSSDGLFTASLSYDKDTRIISTTYAIVSGVPAQTNLNVSLWDSYGNTTVCSDGLNAAGGTLTCTVPSTFGNATVHIKLTSGTDVKRTASINLYQEPDEIYGSSLVFIGLSIMLLIIGMSVVDNPVVLGFMLVVGAIVLSVLSITSTAGWIGGGATILWFVISVVIILIKGSNRQ